MMTKLSFTPEDYLPPFPSQFMSSRRKVYCPPHAVDVDLSLTHNPLGFTPRLHGMSPSATSRLARYPEMGFMQLRRALAEHHQVSPECISVGAGIDGLLIDLLATFLHVGEELLLPAHTFPNIAMFGHIRGVRSVRVPMRDDLSVDFPAIRSHVSPRTRLVYLCNPNNPTGLAEPAEAITALAQDIRCLVVVDEANIDYAGQSCLPFTQGFPNLLVLRTFSKAYGLASARVGYCVASPDLIRFINSCRPPFPISTLAADMAQVALEDRDHLGRSVHYIRQETAFMSIELSKRGFGVRPSEANCFVSKVPEEFENAAAFQAALSRYNAAVVGGVHFDLDDSYIRIAPQLRETNLAFLQAVDYAQGEKWG